MKDIPLEEVYIFLLERTEKQFKKYKKDWFKSKGVNVSSEQWVVLKKIGEEQGINQNQVAQATAKEPASVTRIIDLLVKKGLIKRTQDPNDRRAFKLSLTANGKKYITKITPLAKKIRAAGLQDVSDRELKAFKKVINKIYANFGGTED